MTEDLPVGIGDALSTDYFLLRDQLTDTQLDHLARARRFVDEEVLPSINDYGDRDVALAAISTRIEPGQTVLVAEGEQFKKKIKSAVG